MIRKSSTVKLVSIIVILLAFIFVPSRIYASSHFPPPLQNDVTVTAAVDREDPTVNITNPGDGDTVSSTVVVTADATDDGGITKVEFYVNGFLRLTDVSEPYTFSWNTINEANGFHTLQAIAYDIVNNTATDSINVTVDNPIPPAPVEPTPSLTPTTQESPKIEIPLPFRRNILIDLPDITLIGPGAGQANDFVLGFIIVGQIAFIILLLLLIRKSRKGNKEKNSSLPPTDKQPA